VSLTWYHSFYLRSNFIQKFAVLGVSEDLNLDAVYFCLILLWFVFQLPRLYNVYKEMGIVTSFQNILDNIFIPLFEVTVDPDSHPQLHVFLKQVCYLPTESSIYLTRPYRLIVCKYVFIDFVWLYLKLLSMELWSHYFPIITYILHKLYSPLWAFQVVGLDLVDDESKPERRPTKHMPTPAQWTNIFNPAFSYYVYYCYANLYTLNKVCDAKWP